MKRVLTALGAIALLQHTCPAALAQDDVRVFKPATAWAADYGDDYCRLARDFTDGKTTLSLAMDRIQPVNSVRVIVMGEDIARYGGIFSAWFIRRRMSPSSRASDAYS